MAQRDLYVDTDANQLVTSEANSSPAPFPPLIQGDTISLRIFLLARTKGFDFTPPIYTILDISNMSCRVGLGPKDGLAGSVLYTQQFTWLKDSVNQCFYGDLPLNTTGIAQRIGSSENSDVWFEIEITQNGFPWTVLQRKIPVQAEVIESNAITTPPGLTALSAEEANAIFLKRRVSGVIYLEDINNPGQFIALYNENGSFQASPVSGNLPL